MDLKDFVTSEQISKRFKSQFELVNYAISLAVDMIKTGRGPRVKTDNQNCAQNVLLEILNNRDTFEEVPECHEDEAAEVEAAMISIAAEDEDDEDEDEDDEDEVKAPAPKKSKPKKKAVASKE